MCAKLRPRRLKNNFCFKGCKVDSKFSSTLSELMVQRKSVRKFKKQEVDRQIIEKIIEADNFTNKIVTLRISGELETGKISDVKIRDHAKKIEEKGAFYVMKNTNKLKLKEFEEIRRRLDKLEGKSQSTTIFSTPQEKENKKSDYLESEIKVFCKNNGLDENRLKYEIDFQEEYPRIINLPKERIRTKNDIRTTRSGTSLA